MPTMLSSLAGRRKQLDSCGWDVPAWKRVGDAWMNHFSDIRWYVSNAACNRVILVHFVANRT